MTIRSTLPAIHNTQLATGFEKQTDAAKTNAMNAAERALASKLDENSPGAKAFKASKTKQAKQAQARALANMQRQQKAFLTKSKEATVASPAFSSDTLSRAEELTKQGNLIVTDDVLRPYEVQAQQLIDVRVAMAKLAEHDDYRAAVEGANFSKNEAKIEAVLDTPYRDQATQRINALSNAPELPEERNDLIDKLREDADSGKISKDTFRIYAKVLHDLNTPKKPEDHRAAVGGNRDILYENEDVREEAAEDPNTDPATLSILADDDEESVRERVASNPSTPAVTLSILAQDPHRNVRAEVASNPSTPTATLNILAQDRDDKVRAALGLNPNTPVAFLNTLAQSVDMLTRRFVGRNPSTPAATLNTLAQERDPWIRRSVASNPSTPAATLERLAQDENPDVREEVASNPSVSFKILKKLADDKSRAVRAAVSSNPNTPVATLDKLADDEDVNVCGNVASNPNTLAATLDKLAQHEQMRVRYDVAKNPNTLGETLRTLVEDSEWLVLEAVAENPNTPAEAQARLGEIEQWAARVAEAISLAQLRMANSHTAAGGKLNPPATTWTGWFSAGFDRVKNLMG